MTEKTENDDMTLDDMTLKEELRSIYFAMLGFLLMWTDYMEEEFELATWRRVLLTVFIGTLVTVIVTEISRLVVYTLYAGISFLQNTTPATELFNLLREFGLRFIVGLLVVIITAYIAHLWFENNDFEANDEEEEIANPLISYVQVIALFKALEDIVSTLFIGTGSLISVITTLNPNRTNSVVSAVLMTIGVLAVIYLYYVLSRALQTQTESRGLNFWVPFIFIMICYNGLSVFIVNWLVPTVFDFWNKIAWRRIS